jgi:UDP-glucose:glycoprotein glucosyltransferase
MSPPNGLQLTLSEHAAVTDKSKAHVKEVDVEADGSVRIEEDGGDDQDGHYSDTLVMKNLGYWQLRANPGVWHLNFAENSRGSEIFNMVEGDVKNGVARVSGMNESNNTKYLVLGDFVSRTSTLLVKRKPGYERSTLFYEKNKASDEDEDDVINVFSLATGHQYERFLKIMMLSVTKRTSSKVKFWLFENFLSPTFKASAIAMAERIGCDVEFVTYKWPEWLRGQSEKQRIIWGYKILFLDVLFPLNLKKIIYVDADQVVRGDLKELWDMDLEGAPYGYTPMCSSRDATVGFQFWNSGFWASHLRGKPYHISALYVVDLETFRKTLVGDNLRAIYQQLSADPNSLANLDQDLPNYAQHQVPIFSLPQEWLWCESWCSDETKADAKTIDLCNNPLHKEPKVSMAKRIISGELFEESWVELDAEVEMYEKEYLGSIEAPGTCGEAAACAA